MSRKELITNFECKTIAPPLPTLFFNLKTTTATRGSNNISKLLLPAAANYRSYRGRIFVGITDIYADVINGVSSNRWMQLLRTNFQFHS